jgi:hypothetical protein
MSVQACTTGYVITYNHSETMETTVSRLNGDTPESHQI